VVHATNTDLHCCTLSPLAILVMVMTMLKLTYCCLLATGCPT
jgi:hypothetical protein